MRHLVLVVGLLVVTPLFAAPPAPPPPAPCTLTCENLGRECGPKPGCAAQSCGTCSGTLTCSAAGYCTGTAPTPNLTPFAAGALIIPMDTCYNPPVSAENDEVQNNGTSCVTPGSVPSCYANYTDGGIRLPFGLLYLLLQNHIPVSIILNPYKTYSTAADFTVTGGPQPGVASPPNTVTFVKRSGASYIPDAAKVTCGTNTVSYNGMPFVVEAPYVSQALAIIAGYSSAHSGLFDEVALHVINYSFSAPLKLKLAGPPKPVLIAGSPLDTYFEQSEADSVSPAGSTYVMLKGSNASNWYFDWPVATLGAHPACPGGKCSALTYTNPEGETRRIVDVVWTQNGKVNGWGTMPSFLAADGTTLVVADASTWEATAGGATINGGLNVAGNGAQRGPYCAAVTVPGTNRFQNPGGVGVDYPASNLYLQLGGIDLFTHGGGGGDGSMYKFNSFPNAHTHGLVSEDNTYYSAIAGHPTVAGTQVKGDVVFLGSLNSWHGAAGNKDAGLHIMYNTLLTAGEDDGTNTDTPTGYFDDVELTRSSPVAKLTGQVYLGTFDWKIPEDPAVGGTLFYSPTQKNYPYLTGHFREYSSAVGSSTLKCDPITSGATCAWDLAQNIPAWNGRRAFVASLSGSTYSLATAASQAADATVAFIAANIGTKLGAIDYSTGAVIEGKGDSSLVTIASAKSRPTVAYVGARDGFLHAVCADTTCYGYSPGTELWAILPIGVKAQITAGQAAKDFRNVNVGGAIRVGDFQDAFLGQAASYRTVLVGGTRESGHVFAMDISNPNPANVNQDGLRYLWEQDGTVGVSGTEKMGPTLGATIAAKGTTGYAIVTSARQAGLAPGINTYVLRMSDGVVLAFNQKLYARNIKLASGALAPIPTLAPALATVVDADENGDDETIFVSDYEGAVRKLRLNTDGTLAGSLVAADASTGCVTGIACQPVGVSTTIGRNGAGNLVGFFATGGADFARVQSPSSRALGFLVNAPGAATTANFDRDLGTVSLPTGSAPANVALTWPLRVYAQLTIAGTDLYAVATTLAVGDAGQISLPLQWPGVYGQVLRWGGLDGAISSTATALIGSSSSFSGGAASVVEMNTSSGSGTLALVGAGELVRMSAPTTSLGSSTFAIRKSSSGGSRAFEVKTWFDLVD